MKETKSIKKAKIESFEKKTKLSKLCLPDKKNNQINCFTENLIKFLLPHNNFNFNNDIISGDKKTFELLKKEVQKCEYLSPEPVNLKKLENLKKFKTSKGLLVYIRNFNDEEIVTGLTSKQKKIFFLQKNFKLFLKILKSLDLEDGNKYFFIHSSNEKNVIITLSLVLERILSENLYEFDFHHKSETYEEMEQYFQKDICHCYINEKKCYLFSYDQLKYVNDLEEIFRLNSQVRVIQTEIDKSFYYDTDFFTPVNSSELENMSKKVNILLKKFVEYFGEDAPYRVVIFE